MNMTALLLGGPECLPRSMGILFSVALRLIADFQKTARNTAFSGSLRLLGQELSGGQLNGVKESQKTNSARLALPHGFGPSILATLVHCW